MTYTSETLIVRAPTPSPASGVVNRVTASQAGWSLLNAELRRLRQGEVWAHETGDHEAVIVLLGGRCAVESSRGEWRCIGERAHVFAGMPWALYLPRRTRFTLTALSPSLELGHAWVATDQDHPARLVTPADSQIELRGGGHASRQINSILPPGFDCHRLVAVEVFTPGGNWSSYPPHKHDVHRVGPDGALAEADLEELYLFKLRRPEGFAVQRVYTDDRRIDATVAATDGDFVLVPEGYHPVSAPEGYDCYYLNFLAGSAQTLAATDDPAHAWIKGSWAEKDPRVPMVTHAAGAGAPR